MRSLSAAILVACWTATFGLHSSSSTTSSYSYLALVSALRSRTARSAELRPPRPFTETPPVSGPMNPTLTVSLAWTARVNAASSTPATTRRPPCRLLIACLHFARADLRRGVCHCKSRPRPTRQVPAREARFPGDLAFGPEASRAGGRPAGQLGPRRPHRAGGPAHHRPAPGVRFQLERARPGLTATAPSRSNRAPTLSQMERTRRGYHRATSA